MTTLFFTYKNRFSHATESYAVVWCLVSAIRSRMDITNPGEVSNSGCGL